jgi:hypothetical protein
MTQSAVGKILNRCGHRCNLIQSLDVAILDGEVNSYGDYLVASTLPLSATKWPLSRRYYRQRQAGPQAPRLPTWQNGRLPRQPCNGVGVQPSWSASQIDLITGSSDHPRLACQLTRLLDGNNAGAQQSLAALHMSALHAESERRGNHDPAVNTKSPKITR